jgi:hypothetical protein
MNKPLVAMIAGTELPAPLHGLLADLSAHAHPVLYEGTVASRFRAAVVAAPSFLDRAPAHLPLAVWIDDPDDVERLLAHDRVVGILSSAPTVVDAAGRAGVFVAPEPVHIDARYVAPAVRAHVRRARGLPVRAVVEIDGAVANWCGEPVDAEVVDTAIACASVVVARSGAVLHAMAWGAPVVSDAESLAAIGARAGRDALVGGASDADAVELLLAEEDLASALSRRGRRFYEQRFDRRQAVRTLVRRLDLRPYGIGALQTALDALWTPADAPSAVRAYDRCAPLTGTS